MTRMRNIVLGGLAALAIGGAASSALAEESGSFENRLSGATIGLPLGALPPAGLYTGLETAYLGMPQGVPSSGSFLAAPGAPPGSIRLTLPAIANAIPLLYVPGWNFLGATYAMSVVQAFYANHSCITGSCASGIHTSAMPQARRSAPAKPGAATPTIVNGLLLKRYADPTTDGSELNLSFHA